MRCARAMSISSPDALLQDRSSSRSAPLSPIWRSRRSIRGCMTRRSRHIGAALLACIGVAAIGARVLAPHGPDEQYRELLNAPPTIPHLVDDGGAWHAPFVYRWVLANRLEQRFEQDRTARIPLVWF